MNIIYEEAGYIGVNPLPYTLRDIIIMGNGKRKHEWAQNSSIVSMIYNTNCKVEDQKDPVFFNPTLSEVERMGQDIDPKPGWDALRMMLDTHLMKRKMEK